MLMLHAECEMTNCSYGLNTRYWIVENRRKGGNSGNQHICFLIKLEEIFSQGLRKERVSGKGLTLYHTIMTFNIPIELVV